MKKIGLILYGKKGHKEFDKAQAPAEIYAYHPTLVDVEVLFSPDKKDVRLFRWGPPFDWLVERLQRRLGDEYLDFVRLAGRRKTYPELGKVIAAGLIGPNTKII